MKFIFCVVLSKLILFIFRQDTLSKLGAEVVFEEKDGDSMATIPILQLEKNSTRNKVRGYISLQSFPTSSLDPVLYLKAYLNRTCEARFGFLMEHGYPPSGLFIAISSPHQPVVPSTLAKWLLSAMQLSGISTDVYKAQSIRAASAAEMKTKGMSLRQILDRGFWSQREGTSRVFKRFYDKPVE